MGDSITVHKHCDEWKEMKNETRNFVNSNYTAASMNFGTYSICVTLHEVKNQDVQSTAYFPFEFSSSTATAVVKASRSGDNEKDIIRVGQPESALES